MKKYDALIIGTGQAGPGLARRLAGAGWQIAVAERKLFGGTCVNTGCIPTKALVASARAAHMARRGEDFGVINEGTVRVDMKKVKSRKDSIVRKSNEGVEKSLKDLENCTVYEGHAQFDDEHTVRIGDHKIQAEKIFINVGARAAVPDGFGHPDFWTNSSMMDVDFVPKHLIIAGGSYIGLEFGQMYRRFGSEVTIVERNDRLIGRDDEDVSKAVQEIVENEGIQVRLSAECLSAEKEGDVVRVRVDCDDNAEDVTGSHLLLAVGRRPNTDDLGLDRAGIDMDDRGFIVVDEKLQTSQAHVWALGDCNGKGAFTHTSYNDFEIVAGNLLDGESRSVHDRILTYGLFIDPPLGRAGMTEAEVRKSGRKALMAKRPMSRVARAVEKGETQGFMKVLVDAESKKILGAAILGPGGDEIIHSILDIMYADAPYTVIQRAMHIHPTVSELIPTMLGDLSELI